MPRSSNKLPHQDYQMLHSPQMLRNLPAALTISLIVSLTISLAGCVAPRPASGLDTIPEWSPPPDSRAWPVDSAASRLELRVFRAGPLASVGHNHVIEFPVGGAIYRADRLADSGFRLVIPVTEAVIDDPVARQQAGDEFSAEVSEQARAGTRQNMLGASLLDAEHHPRIVVESRDLQGSARNLQVTVQIHLRGRVFERRLPATITADDGNTLQLSARFELTQTGLGLVQYSALGGGLKVRNAMEIQLDVVANRSAP